MSDEARIVDVNAFFRQNPEALVGMCRDCGALVLAGGSWVQHNTWHDDARPSGEPHPFYRDTPGAGY